MSTGKPLRVYLLLGAVRSATAFVEAMNIDTIDDDHLMSAMVYLYVAAGLPQDQAAMLANASIDREQERFLAVVADVGRTGE